MIPANKFILIPIIQTVYISNKNKILSKIYNNLPGKLIIGSGLIIAGIIDAAFNPFAFSTAPELFTTGVAVLALSSKDKW